MRTIHGAWTVAGVAILVLAASVAAAGPAASRENACSTTTRAAHSACLFDSLDRYWTVMGKCQNERDTADRGECSDDARAGLREANAACAQQREARDELCGELGEQPYDPPFEAADFVDPNDIGHSVAPNPWFPLLAGRTLVYRSPHETVHVTITDEIRTIDNVPCRVVLDEVEVDGELAESTIDWFAQDRGGNVWYCGEATAEYEDGIPVNVDGSFQADVDGARPGLIAKAAPAVGDAYRQEFDLGNAEDAAKVLDLHGSATTPAASCAGSCLVTQETTALEPATRELKYYKSGVGLILQVKSSTGERLELVEIRGP